MNRGNNPQRGLRVAAGVAAAIAALGTTAHAARTPEQLCEAGKNRAAASYFACLGNAEKTYVVTGNATLYAADLADCESTYAAKWGKLESKAEAAGTTCPSTGDQAAVQDFADACAQSVAAAVGGGALPLDVISCNADLGACNTDLSATNADLANCESDLAACTAPLQAQRLKTGQTLCWDETGTEIPCAGTGQDGDVQAGVAVSFTDNGDGTISDNRTGLMWERQNADGGDHDVDASFTWTEAFKRVKVLNGDATGCIAAGNPSSCCTGAGTGSCTAFAGHTDWRVPNLTELQSLVNYGQSGPATFAAFFTDCTGGCTTCSCTGSNAYWSSTSNAGFAVYAFPVRFNNGDVYSDPKTAPARVRAVRSGS